jgi:hypothetical protein
MTYFQEKFHLLEGPLSNFSTQKLKKIKTPQNKENAFLLNSLMYLLPVQKYMKHSDFQTFPVRL